MTVDPNHIEQMLDRRLRDFEKIMDTRLTSIQEGVTATKDTMAVFVDKVANMHVAYVPRSEIEREQKRMDEEVGNLKADVKRLEAWRNYLAGSIAVLVFVIGLVARHLKL